MAVDLDSRTLEDRRADSKLESCLAFCVLRPTVAVVSSAYQRSITSE